MRKWQQQAVKFGMVGVLNTIIDFGLFNLLMIVTAIHSGAGLGIINAAAISAAAANSYFLNRAWAFNATNGKHRIQLSRFILATGLGMLANSLIVMATSVLARWMPVSPYIIVNGGKLLGAVFSAAWNFFFYRNWVFNTGETVSPDKDKKSAWVPGLVSIVVPAYNEAERLPDRLEHLASGLPSHFPVEIIVVDDGSTDQTGEIARKFADKHPWVRCLGYAKNAGKGEAVRTGVSAAAGEFVIFTDADNTFTCEHIVSIAEKLKEGAEVAIGVRRAAYGERVAGESGLRHFMGKSFNFLVQALVLPGLTDTQCGLKGFGREAAREIFSRQHLRGFAFDVELLALARALKYKIVQVPVQANNCEGSRVNCFLTPLQMGWDLLKLKFGLLTNRYGLPGLEKRAEDAFLAAGLFAVALAVRIPWLWVVPRYIDELKEVNLAYQIYMGRILPLHNMAHDIGAMHNYILAGIFKVLGPNIYWPRLYVAVTSALTVVLVYHLGKRLYGRWTGIIAAVLLLANGMDILVTHMAWANCTTPFFFTLALLACVIAEQEKSGPWLVAAGLLWAAALQTHSSVIIYVLAAAIYLLRPAFRRKTGIGARWFAGAAAAFLIGYANMIYYNIVSLGGSIIWLSTKRYALESSPGPASFGRNLEQMFIELIRSVSSTYSSYHHLLSYLVHPAFSISIIVLGIGGYFAVKTRKSLPVWMMASGFAIMPWINQRYTFYLATRYIMPIVICAILLVAFGTARLTTALYPKLPETRKALIPAAAVFLAIAFTQLVPYYAYCARLAGTNMSNAMSLHVFSAAEQMAEKGKALVLVEDNLPLENNPLPELFALDKQKYRVLPREAGSLATSKSEEELWLKAVQAQHGQEVIGVMTGRTYHALRSAVDIDKVKRFSTKVVLRFSPSAVKQHVVYVVEIARPDKPLYVASSKKTREDSSIN